MKPWIFIGLAAVAVGTAHAQAYKWVDDNGHVEYGDRPPAGAQVTPLRNVAPPPAPENLNKRGRAAPRPRWNGPEPGRSAGVAGPTTSPGRSGR